MPLDAFSPDNSARAKWRNALRFLAARATVVRLDGSRLQVVMARKAKSAVKRPLTPDEMGRAGQTEFGKLCDLGSLIATDSARADRMGWDYHVEVSLEARRGAEPFDKRHKVPDMKVQVKTIWADNDSVDVELIAAERLARWEYPSFIAILRLNMDKSFRDAYIIHLLDGNLARILKALREAEAQNGRSIKNRKLTFNISAGTKIAIDGDALANALREAIGHDGRNYGVRKREQLDNLGYGTHRVSGLLQLVAKDEDEALNIFLGTQTGRVTKIEADEVRFDIPTPLFRHTGALIEVRPESRGPCQIVISSTRDHKRARFDAELYFASLGGPDAPWKLRAASDVVEVIASKESPEASFRIGISRDGRYTLDQRISTTQAHLIIASGALTLVIRTHSKTLITFEPLQHQWVGDPGNLEQKFEFLIGLRDLMAELGLRDLRLSDGDIAENIGSIRLLLKAQRPVNGMVITVSGNLLTEMSSIQDYQEGLLASKIEFPSATIAFWAHMHLVVHTQDNTFQLKCSEFVLRDIALVDSDEDFVTWAQAASKASGLDFVVRLERPTFDAITAKPET